jgi:single-strand DNA-binding protein
MKNIAEFRILGNIGSIDSREAVVFLSVASNYNRKVDGEWTSDAHWNRITCFGKLAERADTMMKGDLVHIAGRVRQSSFESEGETRYSVDLIAERMAVIVSREGEGDK